MSPDIIEVTELLKRAIRSGDYGEVEILTEKLIEAEAGLKLSSNQNLSRIKMQADTLSICIEAGLAGFKNGRKRAREVADSHSTLVTYDRGGAVTTLSNATPRNIRC